MPLEPWRLAGSARTTPATGQFDSSLIDYTTIAFMIAAGTNFTLLYLTLLGGPKKLWADVEFRTYIGIIVVVTLGIVFFGMQAGDEKFDTLGSAVRYGLFQVVSVLTTTGYGTADFDQWNNFGRGILLLLMFVGGCAGSTRGGMKVIRHILFYKILRSEVERSHHPRVVRFIRIGGTTIDDPHLAHGIVVYFSLILAIFVFGWLALITFEPDSTWGDLSLDADRAIRFRWRERRKTRWMRSCWIPPVPSPQRSTTSVLDWESWEQRGITLASVREQNCCSFG